MEKYLNSAGYDLYEIAPNAWMIHVKGTPKTFDGTFKEVVKYAVENLGFKLETFNVAIEEFLDKQRTHDHNGIHFGMYRGFLFTFKKEFGE